MNDIDYLNKVCRQIHQRKDITREDFKSLKSAYGQRFQKAYNALKEGNVKRYIFEPSGRVVWIVVGKKRDYLILPAAIFCSCDDFYFKVMERKVTLCYHLIAQKIAESLGAYDTIQENDEFYDILMREWRTTTP